jgi:hypothetical protein
MCAASSRLSCGAEARAEISSAAEETSIDLGAGTNPEDRTRELQSGPRASRPVQMFKWPEGTTTTTSSPMSIYLTIGS